MECDESRDTAKLVKLSPTSLPAGVDVGGVWIPCTGILFRRKSKGKVTS